MAALGAILMMAGGALVAATTAAGPASATTSCGWHYAPYTSVRSNGATNTVRQVVVLHLTSGHVGWARRYQWTNSGCKWVQVGYSGAVFGTNGLRPASQRVQGSNTTPAGTFRIPYVFGQGNPGTKMPYTKINSWSQWWDERPWSSTYNRLIHPGGSCDLNGCEQLMRDVPAGGGYLYTQSIVIGYNYYPTQHRSGGGSGAGIFLHYAHSYTTGCVGETNLTELTNTVRWLDPAMDPRIVIN